MNKVNTIVAGNTYKTKEGYFTCIYVSGKYAWMVSGARAAAYVWTLHGVALSLGCYYNVIWNRLTDREMLEQVYYRSSEDHIRVSIREHLDATK